MGSYVGKAYDGKKPKIVSDMYRSTEVKGEAMKTRVSGATPRSAHRGPVNQYGENRIIAGGKGKKK